MLICAIEILNIIIIYYYYAVAQFFLGCCLFMYLLLWVLWMEYYSVSRQMKKREVDMAGHWLKQQQKMKLFCSGRDSLKPTGFRLACNYEKIDMLNHLKGLFSQLKAVSLNNS